MTSPGSKPSLKSEIKLVGRGTKASLWTRSRASAAREPGEQMRNVLRLPQSLPILLAGPVVRKVSPSQATIWLATSADLTLTCKITDTDAGDKVVGSAAATSTKLGERLFIHLATVAASIPVSHVLAYNFDIRPGKDPDILGFDGDVLLTPEEVALGKRSLPTFFLAPPQADGVRVAHASCRKLHGPGTDAIARLEALLTRTVSELRERPSALHLTGDQIYADDVDGTIIQGLSELGRTMLGWEECFPPSNKRVVDFGPGARGFVRDFGCTVDASCAGNHLLGFGDFAAMYVLAWSPEIWSWPGLRVPPSFQANAGQFASPAIRRVLANVPCYMMFDDHEVTDDWNLNAKWARDIKNSVGRRLVANALAGYWAFQGCGNDTSGRDESVRSAIASYVAGKGANAGAFESAMLDFHQWHFTAPTSRPTIVLDTRTRRDFPEILSRQADPPAWLNPPVSLLNDAGFQLFEQSIKAADGGPDDPLIVVSPAPFFGYKQAEDGQAILANIGLDDGPSPTKPVDAGKDPEAWSFNRPGFARFLRTMAQSGRRRFLILSGDVHYGFTAIAACTLRSGDSSTTIAIVQATSSSLRNHPEGGAATALWSMNKDDENYLMIGHWSGGKYWLQSAEFLSSHRLGIPDKWDMQVRWKYLPMGAASVVTENNAGTVVANRLNVTHTLLEASGASTSASISWADILKELPTPVREL